MQNIDENQIFVAAINITENIQNEDNSNENPVLIIAIPIFEENKKIGYLTTHYLGTELFNDLGAGIEIPNYLMVLSHDEYWYYNELNPELEWKTENGYSFFDKYPTANEIKYNDGSSFYEFTSDGLFLFKIVEIVDDLKNIENISLFEDLHFHIVKYLPYDYFIDMSANIFNQIYLFPVIVFLMLLVFNLIISNALDKSKYRQKLIKEYATIDKMTGTYNRRAGLEIFERFFLQSIRSKEIMSIIFYDINNLKKVNDTYGHGEGDFLINKINELVFSTIRQSDIIIRMGEDEFLIVLPHCNYQEAAIIEIRIQEKLSEFNEIEKKPYLLSLSSGIVDTTESFSDTDQLINVSDKRMYENKKKYKLDHLLNSIK